MKRHKGLIRVIILCLILSFTFPLSVSATTTETFQPYASRYLTSYNTYICDMGGGRIEIWYDVTGTGDMDEIGVLAIELYEVNSDDSLTWIKTFLFEDYDTMLVYDDWTHTSYVSYQGTAGKQYKAYVCIWAGKNGNGDTRYMWATM